MQPHDRQRAYGEQMARYLHLTELPLQVTLGSKGSELAVTRLHAPNGCSDLTSPIPSQKTFSIHPHLSANRGGRLWLAGKLVPTGKRPSGGVTILDLEQEPIAFFPNPIDVVQFYIPRAVSLSKMSRHRWQRFARISFCRNISDEG